MKKLIAALFLLWSCAPAAAQIVGTLPFQLQNGTTADATQVMADFNKILNDVNTNGAKNGVNTDITALNALVTPITPSQGGATIYFASTSGGTANAQTVASPTPTGFTLVVGKRVTFIAGFTNTGAMTLNVNSTGATNVFRYTPAGPVALLGGEVVAGNYVEAVYDGTRYQLYTPAIVPGYGPLTTISSAATVDLGTASSHNVLVSGTVTVTAFGSTAITSYPVYRIKFDNVLTLTHNATSLILPGGANIVTAANDSAFANYLGSGNWQVTQYSKASGAAVATAVSTQQTFASGSGTYTTPANTRYIRVRMVGAGGGGGGGAQSGTGTAGGAGGNTTFSTFTANGGSGGGSSGAATNSGGAGGTASGGTINRSGQRGGDSQTSTAGVVLGGIGGGSSLWGGGGLPILNTGQAGVANTGGGSSGGSANATNVGGGGGGGGGSVEGWIASPAATYSYAVGAAGSAGTAGTGGQAGNTGSIGFIIVEEFY